MRLYGADSETGNVLRPEAAALQKVGSIMKGRRMGWEGGAHL